MSQSKRPPGRPRRADIRVPTDVAIVTAAADLFMDMGYRPVTMEMVAEAAGVTKAAVYYHFRDKASLFAATTHHVFSRARRATQTLFEQNMPLRQQLQEIARVVLALAHPFTRFDATMHEAAQDLSPEQISQVRTEEQGVAEVVEQAISSAAERGEIRATDPVLVAHAFLALLRVGQALGADGKRRFPNVSNTADLLIAVLWEGVGGTP